MNQQEICNLLNLIKESTFVETTRNEDDVNLKISVPSTGDRPAKMLFGTFTNCKDFYLQPFRNDRTVLTELREINLLEPRLHFAEIAPGGKIKLHCSHDSEFSGTLYVTCDAFHLYSESFDRLNVEDFLQLAGEVD